MSDETDTKKHRRLQTSTERDIQGLAKLRERARRPSDQELRALETAEREEDDAVPDPFEGVDTGITPRIAADEDMRRLYARSAKNRQLILAARREAADRDLEIAGEQPPATRLSKIEGRVRIVNWLLTAIAIPVVSSTYLVVKYVYSKGGDDTRAQIETKLARDDIDAMKRQIEALTTEVRDNQELARLSAQRLNDLLRAQRWDHNAPIPPLKPTKDVP